MDKRTGTLKYMLDPNRYRHVNNCRHEFGIVGGSGVSHMKGNLVDIENDLRNTTRANSQCPTKKHLPLPKGSKTLKLPGTLSSGPREVSLEGRHLPGCQMLTYGPIPIPAGPKISTCYGQLLPSDEYWKKNGQKFNHK